VDQCSHFHAIMGQIKILQLWTEVNFYDLIQILLIFNILGVICHCLCVQNDWTNFQGRQNLLPMVEWKIISLPNISHDTDNQMIIIFPPFTLLTVHSRLNLGLTSWTGMAENIMCLVLILCCYTSGLVHTCTWNKLTTRWSQSQPNPA
jgi:hypothetical protein